MSAEPLWTADHYAADTYKDSIDVPEGFRLVGFYCEHPLDMRTGERATLHHEGSGKNKSGRALRRNVGKSLRFGDHDHEYGADGLPACPSTVPVFVRIDP